MNVDTIIDLVCVFDDKLAIIVLYSYFFYLLGSDFIYIIALSLPFHRPEVNNAMFKESKNEIYVQCMT